MALNESSNPFSSALAKHLCISVMLVNRPFGSQYFNSLVASVIALPLRVTSQPSKTEPAKFAIDYYVISI